MPGARLVVAALVAAAALQAGCAPAPLARCTEDAQCNAPGESFRRCDVATGVCLCQDDRACSGDQEFCNALGRCQALSGCAANEDCAQGQGAEGLFCDTTTGQCLAKLECDPDEGQLCCTLDSHCPFGQVCSELEKKCVPGCRDDADCRLGDGCVSGGPGLLGTCEEGACTANNLCDFGEICALETQTCVADTRGPYCEGCSNTDRDECGGGGNYCLVDTTDPTASSYFCGVDCTQGQPCPFGYACVDVIIIPQNEICGREICVVPEGQATGTCSQSTDVACAVDDDCPFGSPGGTCPRARRGNCLQDQFTECDTDADCCEGGDCPEGSCMKQLCVGGENAATGFCTCTKDSDCFSDRCLGADLTDPQNPVEGSCELSGHDCYDDGDCDTIACVQGGCLLGANCAPANDRSCADLR